MRSVKGKVWSVAPFYPVDTLPLGEGRIWSALAGTEFLCFNCIVVIKEKLWTLTRT